MRRLLFASAVLAAPICAWGAYNEPTPGSVQTSTLGTNVNSALQHALDGAAGLVGYSQLAADVTTVLMLNAGVATAIQHTLDAASGLVSYSSLASDVTTVLSLNAGVATAIQHTLDAASGLVSYSALASDVSTVLSFGTGVATALQAATNAAGGVMAPPALLISSTAPTFTSGACTGAIGTTNGTAAFTVTTGSGSCGSTIVLGLPTAAHGWMCNAFDMAIAGKIGRAHV